MQVICKLFASYCFEKQSNRCIYSKLAIIYVCKLSANEIYKNMTKKEETYNEAVEKLRKIVADIENGDLDVDVLSEKVKEATRLIKLCKEKLYKVDEEVKKVLEELE
ncbi:hypothetical protein CE91St1_11360 [Parabacteroides goldsteinii]|nr:hypothetical protein CE91St1_11360 [Parabacteroides goldsteinii]GKG77928.1 hypothetical protein CE91St2_11200 [Parabacteroides goldsteinii]